MEYLLDTHALLFWFYDDPRLSKRARQLVMGPESTFLVSAASVWEIATKFRLGKLPGATELLQDLSGWLLQTGFEELPISSAHAERAGSWPHEHRDPFDRILAAQAALDHVPLITNDDAFKSFDIERVW